MRIKKGSEVLVKATVIGDCEDVKPLEERGYRVATRRGEVMVNPDELYVSVYHGNKEKG